MKKRRNTLQIKLLRIFFAAVFVQMLIMVLIMPHYISGVVEDNSTQMTAGTVSALCSNLEIYMNDLEKITIIPYMSDEMLGALKQKKEYAGKSVSGEETYRINAILKKELPHYFQMMHRDVTELLLLPLDGSVYLFSTFSNQYYSKDYDYAGQGWYQEAVNAAGGSVFVGNHAQEYVTLPNESGVFSVARLIRDPQDHEPLAIIMADMSTAMLKDIIDSADLNESSYAAVLDQNWKPVYTNRDISEDMLAQAADGARLVSDGHSRYEAVVREEKLSGWKIAVFLSCEEMRRKSEFVYILAGVIAVIAGCVGFLLFYTFSRSVTNPLKKLVETMKTIQIGEECSVQEPDTRAPEEIVKLDESFHEMMARIDELVEREYRAIVAQKDMEYTALQSQIQPHFIYNTLNIFIGLNRMGEKELLEQSVMSLAEILRYVLGKDRRTTLGRELDIIQQYCRLQKLRFGERLEFEINWDSRYGNCLIPKLLIQPIVENSIIHGIENKLEGGRLTVDVSELAEGEKTFLEIRIEDTGTGFDLETLGENRGIGIQNVKYRLAYIYPNALFRIDSGRYRGTSVIMRISKEELHYDENCGGR